MVRYDDSVKDEARALYLQGLGYKTIANKIKEQYNNSVAHNTIKRWAKQGDWQNLLDKQRKIVKQETASNSTRSTIKNIKTLQAVQSKFISQLKTSSYEIRPYEMVSVIRLLSTLEGAKDLQDELVQEVAHKLPEAMKKAKIPQKQINLVIRYWVEMIREME
tara:strand:- start:2615 stop:3100 length:486 start_codon:yes stop_codon:yes gene_type:complete